MLGRIISSITGTSPVIETTSTEQPSDATADANAVIAPPKEKKQLVRSL